MFCGGRLAAVVSKQEANGRSCKQMKLAAAAAAVATKATTLFSLNIITTPTPSCLIIK